MTFCFLRMQSDITTNKAPSYWRVESETRDAAIQAFCREFDLEVAEIVGEPVWFSTKDNAMLRYLTDDGREE